MMHKHYFYILTLAFLSRCARVIFIVTGNSYRISCYNKGTMCWWCTLAWRCNLAQATTL